MNIYKYDQIYNDSIKKTSIWGNKENDKIKYKIKCLQLLIKKSLRISQIGLHTTTGFTSLQTSTKCTILLEFPRRTDLPTSVGCTCLVRLIRRKDLLELTEWTSTRLTDLLELTGNTGLLESTRRTILEVYMFIIIKSACNFIRIHRVYRFKNINETQRVTRTLPGTLDLTDLLGTLQTGLCATLDFIRLLETLKTGSQVTLNFTGLLGTIQTCLLVKSSLMKLQETTLTGYRLQKNLQIYDL